MSKKIRVFLGGYINFTNAQNLNCRTLAKYLDKDKFECAALLHPIENNPLDGKFNEIKLIKRYRPLHIPAWLAYLRGILWCDVAYLPKGELFRYCSFLLKLFRKKSFTTVEGVISGSNLERLLAIHKTKQGISNLYHYTTKTYAITQFMAKKNNELLGIKADGVLYLGIDTEQFQSQPRFHTQLKNIIFIGNNIRYKGIDDFFELATIFPEISFHIVGGGMGYDVSAEIKKRKLQNCIYHGLLNHDRLSTLLNDMDLHIFPSRSEGFPKVTLETASMGVPSIVYGDYGADEWITTGKNGYVVNTLEEIKNIIKELQVHPEKLDTLAEEAVALARAFDWKIIIKNWENEIESLI